MKVALVGCGKVVERHLGFLRGFRQCRLVAVCDESRQVSERFAKKYRVPAYRDHARLLAEVEPQIVHVLTPTPTHKQIIRDCLQGNAHVIVEKPMVVSCEDFFELRSLALSKNRRLVEVQNYRFTQPMERLEALVRRGRLGSVREVDVRMAVNLRHPGGPYADSEKPHPSYKLPAGVIHDFITHLCYVTLRFVPQFDWVRAIWNNYGGEERYGFDDLDAFGGSGPVHVRIRFSSHTAPESFTVTLRGTKGCAEADLFHSTLMLDLPWPTLSKMQPLVNRALSDWSLLRAGGKALGRRLCLAAPYEGHWNFLRRTYESLQTGSPPPVTCEDVERALRLTEDLLDVRNRL